MLEKFLTFWGLVVLTFSSSVSAQNKPKAELLSSFSFEQLIGGVILLKGQVGNHPDTLNFILDTGSGGISLDSQTVANLQLAQIQSDRTIRGIGGMHEAKMVTGEPLVLPQLKIDSLVFYVNNYTILTSVYGIKIHGVLGHSLFSRYIIKIDFDHSQISFFSLGRFNYPKHAEILRPQIDFLPEQKAFLTEKTKLESSYLYDMGAGICLMLSQSFADKNTLLKDKKTFPKLAQGMGGEIPINLTVMKKFQIGRYKFRKIPTYIFEDINHLTTKHHLGGLIGIDLLRRFNVVLNYQDKIFCIWPNSHFRDSFDYAYSGLELCYLDGKIFVCNVAEKSPSEKVGLKKGDVIISVANDFSNNLARHKQILQKNTKKFKVLVSRNGELIEFTLKPVSIIK